MYVDDKEEPEEVAGVSVVEIIGIRKVVAVTTSLQMTRVKWLKCYKKADDRANRL